MLQAAHYTTEAELNSTNLPELPFTVIHNGTVYSVESCYIIDNSTFETLRAHFLTNNILPTFSTVDTNELRALVEGPSIHISYAADGLSGVIYNGNNFTATAETQTDSIIQYSTAG